MADTVVTTEKIIDKFLEVYPRIEKAAIDGMFANGLTKLKEEYASLDLTGEERAKLTAQYLLSATATIITSSQQATLQLVSNAYKTPSDIAYQEEQTTALRNSLIQNTLIKLFTETNNMIGTLGSGALVAPKQMVYTSVAAAYAALEQLKLTDPYITEFLNNIKPVSELKDYDMRNIPGTGSYNTAK